MNERFAFGFTLDTSAIGLSRLCVSGSTQVPILCFDTLRFQCDISVHRPRHIHASDSPGSTNFVCCDETISLHRGIQHVLAPFAFISFAFISYHKAGDLSAKTRRNNAESISSSSAIHQASTNLQGSVLTSKESHTPSLPLIAKTDRLLNSSTHNALNSPIITPSLFLSLIHI